MPRVKRGTKRNDRRKKILKRASGYFLTKSKLYQAAQEAVERGLKFAYIARSGSSALAPPPSSMASAILSSFMGSSEPVSSWTVRFLPTSPSTIRLALPC
jgi:hypothetical protein